MALAWVTDTEIRHPNKVSIEISCNSNQVAQGYQTSQDASSLTLEYHFEPAACITHLFKQSTFDMDVHISALACSCTDSDWDTKVGMLRDGDLDTEESIIISKPSSPTSTDCNPTSTDCNPTSTDCNPTSTECNPTSTD
jgi:hypothetical protein